MVENRCEVYHKQRRNANSANRDASSSPKSLPGIIATAAAKSD